MKSSEIVENKGFSAIRSPNPFIKCYTVSITPAPRIRAKARARKTHNRILADINEQATAQMRLLITQLAEREGVTEQRKAQDQMLWVQRMNNIRDRATEIVNHDLIYA